MAFVNTKNIIGEQALFDALVSHQITEFNDDMVTELGVQALGHQENLRSVNFPSLTRIGQSAFTNCPNLETIDIGGLLTLFTTPGLSGSPLLKALILRNTSGVSRTSNSSSWLERTTFAMLSGFIYVPRSLLSSYKPQYTGNNYWTPYRRAIRAIEDMPILDAETINLTWTQIKSMIDDESFFSDGYDVEDLKKVTYTDGTTSHTVYFEIAKIDTTNKYVDFVLVNPSELSPMSNSSMVAYSDSLAKARLDAIYNNELPSDLKAAITPITKPYYKFDGEIEYVTAPLWMLNTKDVNYTSSYLKESEGENYTIFDSIGKRVKFSQNTGEVGAWCLGSAQNATKYMAVSTSGQTASQSPTTNGYLVFGFRIQKST